MSRLASAIKPRKGFSEVFHILLVLMLPLLVLLFVMLDLVWVALALILLSKWRVFTVRARYWPSLLRANAVDLIVSLSILALMSSASSEWLLFGLTFVHILWLLFVKPYSDTLWIALQAAVAQFFGMAALFNLAGDRPAAFLMVGAWAVCYFSAYHFFLGFEGAFSHLYALSWGFFGAALTWVLSHWLIFYGPVAQPALILTLLGGGFGALYYADTLGTKNIYNVLQILGNLLLGAVAVFVIWDFFSDSAVISRVLNLLFVVAIMAVNAKSINAPKNGKSFLISLLIALGAVLTIFSGWWIHPNL